MIIYHKHIFNTNTFRRSPLLERSSTSPGPKGPITPSPGPTAPTATRPIPSPGPPVPISGPTIQVSDSKKILLITYPIIMTNYLKVLHIFLSTLPNHTLMKVLYNLP